MSHHTRRSFGLDFRAAIHDLRRRRLTATLDERIAAHAKAIEREARRRAREAGVDYEPPEPRS